MTDKYDVILQRLPGSQIESLRAIRLAGGLELREAKEIYDYLSPRLPCRFLSGVAREKAEQAARIIGEQGGLAEIAESHASHPMVIWPAANRHFERSLFFGLREARKP